MDSSLTRPQTLQELYKTYFAFANKFQFTTLLRNYIQNEEWKDKSQESIWTLLSRISDDIGAVLTDDIVNYTRNVVDINTCKVPQFIEQGRMLSYSLDHLKNSYGFFPKRIQCLVDLFSVNPEYLIGNHKNHILSDQTIKEILIYIKENGSASALGDGDIVDRLIDDPHGLTDAQTYRNFVLTLFYNSIVEALSAPYSKENGQPMVFNMLWEERQNQKNLLSQLDEYKSWVDRYISNEIEHPLNSKGLRNTIWDEVERVKRQKQISTKFSPFIVADEVYFHGLSPTNELSQDELDLVEMVLDYHARTKYDYESQQFVDDQSTQYAYYRELEFCEYVKMVMFVKNNLKSFDFANLSYDPASNKFIQTSTSDKDCLRMVRLFNEGEDIVSDGAGNVVLNHRIVFEVAEFLCKYVFSIQQMRENIKTIALKHAMRGTAALLAHVVNDYLVKELPDVRDKAWADAGEDAPAVLKFGWEIQPEAFLNYGNVKVIEYMDDNEYFNIEPEADVRFTERTNARYWEKLEGMGDDDTLGVLTKAEIRDLYRNQLGMGRLQRDMPSSYDDVCDFLVDLFKIGANPISWDGDELHNPVDDIAYDSEEKYGYTKAERMEVQTNTALRANQERQFMEYSGDEELLGESMYEFVNNRLFYWKNQDYSSHVLHPFMYNLKLWNRLDNIIINGYRDYLDEDLEKYMSSKAKFDELVGEYGECKNFWKYNVMDLTGYTTRYEAAVKDEHRDDENKTTSPLTGYDGLFYPDPAKEFISLYNQAQGKFTIPEGFFTRECRFKDKNGDWIEDSFLLDDKNRFIAAIYSVYWQVPKTTFVEQDSDVRGSEPTYHVVEEESNNSFYTTWYSHLNYTRAEYQKIAMQLWYWRDRIHELVRIYYPITKYCLDVQGNSLIMVQTFQKGDEEKNPYLIDLTIAQNTLLDEGGNQNTHVPFCENGLRKPSELWVKWKSNPIALPAFDIEWQKKTGDEQFDYHYRTGDYVEMGQIDHASSTCNDDFNVVVREWNQQYANTVSEWGRLDGRRFSSNRLPVFFDMEQSANVLALASWRRFTLVDEDGIDIRDEAGEPIKKTLCGRNPLHILSIERTSTSILEYTWEKYVQSAEVISNPSSMAEWLFDAYHYCPANGSLLIPLYSFECVDDAEPVQKVKVLMNLIPTQTLKEDNFTPTKRIYALASEFDLNKLVDVDEHTSKYRFDHPVKVCRNTNMVFSPYDSHGHNKVKCAFLGVYFDRDEKGFDDKNNHDIKSVKFSSCEAATRYEHDSQSTVDLGLVKQEYYKPWTDANGDLIVDDDGNPLNEGNKGEDNYIDPRIARKCHNSYDSNDKYVFVLDFGRTVDTTSSVQAFSENDALAYSYNILSDAGYIPHFAYQSLVKYAHDDGVDGTAYTWRNKYLKTKNHLQFELLGLDDPGIHDAYETMQKMVVEDVTDGCKTLVNPTKLMDDIYRVWCETKGVKRKLLPGEDDPYGYKEKYDAYFDNEYKDYWNPELKFHEDGVVEWDTCDGNPQGWFEFTLPQQNNPEPEDETFDVLKEVLSEYYVSIVRTDNGQFVNEKKYILPPTRLSEFALELTDDEAKTHSENIDHYVKCSLSKYLSPSIEGNHYVPEQVVFTGTQNPFNYSKDGTKVPSKAEVLQYGNGILGVDGIELKIQIECNRDGTEPIRDVQGNIIADEEVVKVPGEAGKPDTYKIDVTPRTRNVERRYIHPYVRFTKEQRGTDALIDRIHDETNTIPEGQIAVILSHRNLDNIAKYHILNTSSNLYYNGSLPKDGKNHFKFSDFKFSETIHLEEVDGGWRSVEKDANGNPLLEFTTNDVKGQAFDDSIGHHVVPPYYIADEGGNPLWFLEQDKLVPSPSQEVWDSAASKWSQDESELKAIGHTLERGEQVPLDDECSGVDEDERAHVGFRENGMTYPIPTIGRFMWAHKVKSKPEKYLDYLYIKRGRLAFKISEESDSFSDAMSKLPPFWVDEATKNKLSDLNDIQCLSEFSTFVHQSEKPQDVKDCGNFNPLVVDARLQYGVEQKEIHNSHDEVDPETGEKKHVIDPDDELPTVICTDEPPGSVPRLIELSNLSNLTRLNLQFEDGEVDDYLKIYTTYKRVDDGHGDFHFDLYFNTQNLFNSPFEYISSVTNQPNVLIIPDSYLYLTGDKYKKMYDERGRWTHNEVDEKKVAALKKGGTLSIYGQVKVYSDGRLSDVKTIRLFSYQVYNVSDDKPKFLIQKTYDVTKATLEDNLNRKVRIEFSDVLWTVDENQFEMFDPQDRFRVVANDIVAVQPVHVYCDHHKDDDFRVRNVSFDIVNDVIDFENTPELGAKWMQERTLRWTEIEETAKGDKMQRYPYYDHWSDRNMKLEVDPKTSVPRMTLDFTDAGRNFETIYLKWRMPRGFKAMDTIDRLQGYAFSSTATNVTVDCGSVLATPDVETTTGHIVLRTKRPGEMSLGLEHSTTARLNGYVVNNLADQIRQALSWLNAEGD